MKEKKLTKRQSDFCNEYIKNGGNASAAYRVIYSASNMKEATVNNNAYKLLQNNDISTRIKKLQNKLTKKVEKEIEFGLKDTVKGIIQIAKNAKTDNNKLKAFDMLMKHFGGYEEDNRQQKTDVNIPITNWVAEGGEGTEQDFNKAFNDLNNGDS